MKNYQDIENQYGLNLFAKRGLTLVKGKKARLWDENGTEYIDCTSGHGVAGIGHANPAIARAVSEQAKTLISVDGEINFYLTIFPFQSFFM